MTLTALQWLAGASLCIIPACLLWSFAMPMLRKARYKRAQVAYRARHPVDVLTGLPWPVESVRAPVRKREMPHLSSGWVEG